MRPEETIESVLDEARRLLRADYGAVVLFSRRTGHRLPWSVGPICHSMRPVS